MKKFILLITCLFSFSIFAESVEVPGKVFYVMPEGEMVKREVSLVVPEKGQGDVILKVKDKEHVAHKFWHYVRNGRTVFNAVFKVEHDEHKAALLLTGSYLRGSNKVKYWGDFYKKKMGQDHDHIFIDSSKSVEDILSHHKGWMHKGGFAFWYDRSQDDGDDSDDGGNE